MCVQSLSLCGTVLSAKASQGGAANSTRLWRLYVKYVKVDALTAELNLFVLLNGGRDEECLFCKTQTVKLDLTE